MAEGTHYDKNLGDYLNSNSEHQILLNNNLADCMPKKDVIWESDLRPCPYQTLDDPRKIGAGADGIVCRISEGLVAKMPLRESDSEFNSEFELGSLDDLTWEYSVTRILEEEGVNVASPKGIFKIKFRGGERPAYVMDHLDGDLIKDLSYSDLNRNVMASFKPQIRKAKDLGFKIVDRGLHNAIWNPETKKVSLIDFARWELTRSAYKNGLFERIEEVEVKI